MIHINYLLVAFVSYLIAESNAGVVSFIKPCKADDKACITSSAQAVVPHIVNGIPDLGIPAIDPIHIDSIRSDEANLKLGFSDITVTGVTKCKIRDMERNTKEKTIKLVAECPLHGVGQYDLNGKLSFIQAFGNGAFQIHTNNVKIEALLKIKDQEKDGKNYWKLTGFDYSYELVEKVHIDLKNLFNGDEERAKPLKQIFENSSNELVREVGGPLIKQLISKYVDVVKKLLFSIPSDELELPSS